MDINGSTPIDAPARRVLRSLMREDQLAKFMVSGATLTQTGPGTFDVQADRAFGPIRLTLTGKLSVTAKSDDSGLTFDLKASHLIGGGVELAMGFDITPQGKGCVLAWAGTVKSRGLASTLLAKYQAEVQDRFILRIYSLKSRLEEATAAEAQG